MDLRSIAGNRVPGARHLPETVYRFGALKASLRTDDPEFRDRFLGIFVDCLEPDGNGSPDSTVCLTVISSPACDPVVAEISPHDDYSSGALLDMLFPDLGLEPASSCTTEGWQVFARERVPHQPAVATRGNLIVVDRVLPWQMLIAHYFLHHVMRLQPEISFFHGATLAIGDRGVLLTGKKGAGKSTLSLALAARGHGFLGDEHAAIHNETREVLPFRRAASIRPGPQSGGVVRFFAENQGSREVMPDGTERLRAPVSRMFPAATPRPARLTHAFFLGSISHGPRATPFDFSRESLPLLAPLHATFPGNSAGARTLMLLRMFASVRCYMLEPGGSPDQTADLVQDIVEGTWHSASRKERNASAPIAG